MKPKLGVPIQLAEDLRWRGSTAFVNWMNTVTHNLSPIYDVTDAGATGNGVTDDTQAITLAIAKAGEDGAALYFPSGTYLADITAFDIPVGCAGIFGDGPGSTVIYPKRVAYGAGTALIDFAGNTNKAYIRDLSVDVQDAVFDGTYVINLSASNLTVQNVDVTGRAAFAVYTLSGTGCRVKGMRITGIGGNGFTAGVFAQGSSTEFHVRGVTQTGDHAYCVNIANGDFNLIEGCSSYAQGSATGAFAFALSTCSYSDIVNCFSLDSYHEAFNLTDCTYCRIMGCTGRWDASGVDFGISVAGTTGSGPSQFNQVIGNTLYNSYTAGICVAQHSQDTLVASNTLSDCGHRVGGTTTQLLSYTDAAGQVCSRNRWSDNYCSTGTATTYGYYESLAGGTTIDNNLVDRNTFLNVTNRYSTFAGTGTMAVDHEWQTWTPTITNTGGGGFTTTVQAARYQLNGKGCSGVLVFTVTAAGGGGYINATLPFGGVSANAGAANGFETVTAGLAVGGSIGTTSINNLRTYNNAATAVLNYKFYLTFNYEMA